MESALCRSVMVTSKKCTCAVIRQESLTRCFLYPKHHFYFKEQMTNYGYSDLGYLTHTCWKVNENGPVKGKH